MTFSRSIWPPVLSNLSKNLQEGERLVLAFSPFIKSDALKVFLDTFPTECTRIVVRWKLEDLLAGASDLGIFDLLEKMEIPLYLHPKIHLKLYEFSSGVAYSGSSNITNSGLSLQENYNEEMGVMSQLDLNSYSQVRRLSDESRRVTRGVVEAYQKAIDESRVDPPIIGKLVLPPMEEKEFLVSELPASNDPQAFLEAVSKYVEIQKICPQMLHDIGTYKLTESDLRSTGIKGKLVQAFQNQAFVKRIVEEIRRMPSMNFGAMTALVHDVAQDVPLPYRSNIKEAIARLYAWLEFCFEDLSSSIPGVRSQVMKSSLSAQGKGHSRQSSRRRRRR